jgi:adenosine deaminase
LIKNATVLGQVMLTPKEFEHVIKVSVDQYAEKYYKEAEGIVETRQHELFQVHMLEGVQELITEIFNSGKDQHRYRNRVKKEGMTAPKFNWNL